MGGSVVWEDVFHCSAGGFSHGLGLALLLRIFHYKEPQVFKKPYCDRYLDLSRPKADKCHEKKPFKLWEKRKFFKLLEPGIDVGLNLCSFSLQVTTLSYVPCVGIQANAFEKKYCS